MPLSSVLGAQSLVRPGVCTSSTRPASPFEGQVIYETDTDSVVVYNGSSWVCVTPKTSDIETNETTSSTTYVDLTTAGPSVSLQTGTKALVTLSCITYRSNAGNTGFIAAAVSGATTLSASDDNGTAMSYHTASASLSMSRTFLVDGLTAGSNTFKMQYRIDGGVAANFFRRSISVVGIP